MKDVSAVWFANQNSYLREAEKSARSFLEHHDNIETVLMTPEKNYDDKTYFSNIVYADFDDKVPKRLNYFKYRIKILDINEKILLFDTDCFFCKNLKPLYDVLEYCDLAAAQAPRTTVSTIYKGSEAFSEINGGVMAFNTNEKVREFFQESMRLFVENEDIYLGSMQEPMRDVLLNWSGKLGYVPNTFNFRFSFGGRVHGPVYIIHGRFPRGEWEDYKRIAKKVNTPENGFRAWKRGELK